MTNPMKRTLVDQRENPKADLWTRCRDCKRVKWCYWPVINRDDGGKEIAVCPKCWDKKS